MNEKKELTKKMYLVNMNKFEISTKERPIIGTEGLASCIGMLFYSEKEKKAVVAHYPSNIDDTLELEFIPKSDNDVTYSNLLKILFAQTIEFLVENNLDESSLKYKIIMPYYCEEKQIKGKIYLENACKSLQPWLTPFEEIPSNAIATVEELNANRFAFDAETGMFVTDKVLFGKDYININSKNKK